VIWSAGGLQPPSGGKYTCRLEGIQRPETLYEESGGERTIESRVAESGLLSRLQAGELEVMGSGSLESVVLAFSGKDTK
jgi:hypothetical protein